MNATTKRHRTPYEAGQDVCIDDGAYYRIHDVEWIGTYPHDYPRLALASTDKPDDVVRKITPSSHGGTIRIVENLAEKTPPDYQYKKGDLILYLGCTWKVTGVELRRPGVVGAADGSMDYQSVSIANLTSSRNPRANRMDTIDARKVRPRLTDSSSLPSKTTVEVLPRKRR